MSGAPTSPGIAGAARLSLPAAIMDILPAGMCWLGVFYVEHPGCGLLHRRARRGAGPPWHAGDLQYRPGQASCAPASPSPGACGRPASGSRWTAGRRYLFNIWSLSDVALAQIRGRLSARARRRRSRPGASSASGSTSTTGREAALGARRKNAGRGLPRPPRLWGCGQAATCALRDPHRRNNNGKEIDAKGF